jgi:short-subunit dehydrogenase
MTKKTVLITGASAGIGKETAKTLIGEGYTVYAAARRVERMDDLRKSGAVPLKMDITREDDLVAVVEQIEKESGGVDILINNAGFGLYGAIEETTIEDARYQFEVNLFGLARITQLVLPYMRTQKWGKIINMSSTAGKCALPMGAWYTATKFAIEGWSDSLRFEVRQFNIDVIIIEPGPIGTEFWSVYVNPMLERSGQGPYGEIANAMANWSLDRQNNPDSTSSPSVIADTISKAIEARRPRTRYAAGKLARTVLFLRRWSGDRLYDRFWGIMLG